MDKKLKINMISESAFTVQGHGVHTAFIETTRALNAREDTDVVTNKFRRPADITHIHTIGLYGLAHLLFGAGKKVVSAHVVPDSFVGSLIGAKYWYWLAKLYLKFFYGRADLVLAVSQSVADQLRDKLKLKVPIALVYNPVDTHRYEHSATKKAVARQQLGIKPEEFVIMCCGQIQPRKGFDTFLDLARHMPDIRFIWVGGMPFKKLAADAGEMNDLIKNAPANVMLPGVVALESVAAYYLASDVFLLPSHQETFGLVIVEAAAAGLPVVLRNIPDYQDTFAKYALLAEEAGFADVIKRLRTDSTAYATARAESRQIAKRFDGKRIAGDLVFEYRKLLD